MQACLLAAMLLAHPLFLSAQEPERSLVESVEFRGNRRVPVASMRARIFTEPGDLYDESALRRDFMALYNTGLFDDIVLSVEEGESGKIIVFEIRERPTIRIIQYEGNSSVTTSDILDRFRERRVGLTVESRYDPTRVKRAEVVLQQLLAERGRQMATVKVEARQIPPSSVALTFVINEGPKVKVGRIDFEGNTLIPRGKLVRAMRNSRPIGIPYSLIFTDLFSKTYDKNKLDIDLELLRGAYQDRGYFQALIEQPTITERESGGGWFRIPWIYPNRPGRKVDITIPIVEGEQFTLGSMNFRNSTIFSDEQGALRSLFDMQEGDLFDVSKIREGLENLRQLYGEYGYINFVASPQTEIDETNRRIDMDFALEEGQQYRVRRIEFVGNTTTRDKVIRREIMLGEGGLFNSRLWEMSILRLNQLDYFEKLDHTTDSQIQTDNRNGTVDIGLTVKEKGKNAIGFSGGVSGLSGSFIGFNYQTNNFMGRGETLTFDAQLGSLERNILFGMTQPYMFDRPLQVGYTLYSRRFSFNEAEQASIFSGQDVRPLFDLLGQENIQNYRQSSLGFTSFASYPLRNNFTRLGFSYGFESSKITTFSTISQVLFEDMNFNGISGPDSLSGIRTSKIIPTISYNTVDHPLMPSRGSSFFSSLELAGLGGNVRFYRPALDVKHFRPFGGNRTLGVHLSLSTIKGYGGRVIPPFSRSYAGGENDVRGFDFFTISPIVFLPDTATIPVLNADGTQRVSSGEDAIGQQNRIFQTMTIPVNRITFPGGDTKVISNIEYRIPIFGPVSLAIFGDFGLNMAWHREQLHLSQRRIDELRSAFPSTDFQNKLEIAEGTNAKWRASTGLELQIIMPVVNAPFRVYYAYNPLRLQTNISPASLIDPAFFPNQATFQNAVTAYGKPRAYSEPASTFRFTIGRTF